MTEMFIYTQRMGKQRQSYIVYGQALKTVAIEKIAKDMQITEQEESECVKVGKMIFRNFMTGQ